MKAWVQPQHHIHWVGMEAQSGNANTQEAEGGVSEAQGHLWPYSEFEASLGERPCLKNK